MLQLGRPINHYKLLSWLCSATAKENLNSRAFYELEGVSFKCMFVAYGVSLNGFIMRRRKVLFVDEAHLSGLYKGTLLAVIALDMYITCSIWCTLWSPSRTKRSGFGF